MLFLTVGHPTTTTISTIKVDRRTKWRLKLFDSSWTVTHTPTWGSSLNEATASARSCHFSCFLTKDGTEVAVSRSSLPCVGLCRGSAASEQTPLVSSNGHLRLGSDRLEAIMQRLQSTILLTWQGDYTAFSCPIIFNSGTEGEKHVIEALMVSGYRYGEVYQARLVV